MCLAFCEVSFSPQRKLCCHSNVNWEPVSVAHNDEAFTTAFLCAEPKMALQAPVIIPNDIAK